MPHAVMQPIRYTQLGYYEALPLTGVHYRATHNLWGATIHRVKTPNRTKLDKIYLKMEDKTESVRSP